VLSVLIKSICKCISKYHLFLRPSNLIPSLTVHKNVTKYGPSKTNQELRKSVPLRTPCIKNSLFDEHVLQSDTNVIDAFVISVRISNQIWCYGVITILRARITAMGMRGDMPCERIKLNQTEAANPLSQSPICQATFILSRYPAGLRMLSKYRNHLFSSTTTTTTTFSIRVCSFV
jgi:hypothetical protein